MSKGGFTPPHSKPMVCKDEMTYNIHQARRIVVH